MIIEPRTMLETARQAADMALVDADYRIHELEQERDLLLDELDRIRRMFGLDGDNRGC